MRKVNRYHTFGSNITSSSQLLFSPYLDEMSLLAADFFYNIHRRFVEILHLTDMFADRAVMLVGDLMQIPPVRQQQYGKNSIKAKNYLKR